MRSIRIVVVVGCLLGSLPGALAEVHKNDAAADLEKASKALGKADWLRALRFAMSARRADPKAVAPYFIGALAQYKLGLYDAASRYIQDGLKIATDKGDRARLQALAGTIGDKKQFEVLLRNAADAEVAGKPALQARTLTVAWQVFPNRTDVGLQAARLWIRLGEPLAAAQIVAYLSKLALAPATRTQVTALATEVDHTVADEVKRRVNLARASTTTKNFQDAERHLALAERLRPNDDAVMWAHLELALGRNQIDEVATSVVQKLKDKRITIDDLLAKPAFNQVLDRPVVQAYLRDGTGPTTVQRVRRVSRLRAAAAITDPRARVTALKVVVAEFPDDAEAKASLEAAQRAYGDSRFREFDRAGTFDAKLIVYDSLRSEFPNDLRLTALEDRLGALAGPEKRRCRDLCQADKVTCDGRNGRIRQGCAGPRDPASVRQSCRIEFFERAEACKDRRADCEARCDTRYRIAP